MHAALEVIPADRAAPRLGEEHELAERALTIARRTALGVLGDREAAADVAQEVAITALRRAASIRDPAKLDAWLHRVAVRAALRQAGRENRRRSAEQRRGFLETTAAINADDSTFELLLAALPKRQRAALTLRYVHDLPDAAIARTLGCRSSTVRTLLSRGRQALQPFLDPGASDDAA
jgi:RNA polymerase sigma factor (sigma-70 family)